MRDGQSTSRAHLFGSHLETSPHRPSEADQVALRLDVLLGGIQPVKQAPDPYDLITKPVVRLRPVFCAVKPYEADLTKHVEFTPLMPRGEVPPAHHAALRALEQADIRRASKAARASRRALRERLAVVEERHGAERTAWALRACETGSFLYDRDVAHHAPILRSDERGVRQVSQALWCHHRLCPSCARRRSAENAERLVQGITTAFAERDQPPALVTLTQRDVPGESLSDAAKRLWDGWDRLRRLKRWKANINGGVVAFEVTRNTRLSTWHVHLHALVDTRWYAQAALLEDWRESLRDNGRGGARIERVRVPAGSSWEQAVSTGVREAVKYVVKGAGGDGVDALDDVTGISAGQSVAEMCDEDVEELVAWLRRRRLVRTFGCLYNVAVVEEGEAEVESDVTDDDIAGYNAVTGELRRWSDCVWRDDDAAVEMAQRIREASSTERHRRLLDAAGPPLDEWGGSP